jgi:hypothetical protein
MQRSFLGDSIQSNHEHESFSMRKKAIQAEHRKECLSFVEEVFGNDPSISGDFIVINFFALVRNIFVHVSAGTYLAFSSIIFFKILFSVKNGIDDIKTLIHNTC